MTEPYKILLILDRSFGDRLAEIENETPIWIVDSIVNRAAVEAYWAKHQNQTDAEGLTVFNADQASVQETFRGTLSEIDLHHGEYSHQPAYSVLKVVGNFFTSDMRESLYEYGFRVFTETPDGFEARKP